MSTTSTIPKSFLKSGHTLPSDTHERDRAQFAVEVRANYVGTFYRFSDRDDAQHMVREIAKGPRVKTRLWVAIAGPEWRNYMPHPGWREVTYFGEVTA